MYEKMISGIPIIIIPGGKKQNRKHRKRRINKKWAKRYGYTYYDLIDYGQTISFDGKVYMSARTFNAMYMNLKKEGMKI